MHKLEHIHNVHAQEDNKVQRLGNESLPHALLVLARNQAYYCQRVVLHNRDEKIDDETHTEAHLEVSLPLIPKFRVHRYVDLRIDHSSDP